MSQPDMTPVTSELSPEEVEKTHDNFHSLVHELISQICSSSNVRSAFGEPLTRDEVTIIPVANVYAGFGAGLGLGSKRQPQAEAGKGGGMGLGGGYITQPLGVWEISKRGVQFRRVRSPGAFARLADFALSLLRRGD